MEIALKSLVGCLLVLALGIIFARCEHYTDNQSGYVVKAAVDKSRHLSRYTAREDNFLANHIYFTDSVGRFRVGDTLFLAKRK